MVNEVSYIEVSNSKIISIEKGNILNPNVMRHVVVFTVEDKIDNKNIKAIIKDDIAKSMYWNFLNNFNTIDTEKESFGSKIIKTVNISFRGDVKEVRDKEVVIHNLRNIVFTYTYKIIPNE